MSQPILDTTGDTLSAAERLRYLRALEDSQTPVIFTDRQKKKHLVYVTKVTLLRPVEPLDKGDEVDVQIICVDADDLFWPQPQLKLGISLSVATVLA